MIKQASENSASLICLSFILRFQRSYRSEFPSAYIIYTGNVSRMLLCFELFSQNLYFFVKSANFNPLYIYLPNKFTNCYTKTEIIFLQLIFKVFLVHDVTSALLKSYLC